MVMCYAIQKALPMAQCGGAASDGVAQPKGQPRSGPCRNQASIVSDPKSRPGPTGGNNAQVVVGIG